MKTGSLLSLRNVVLLFALACAAIVSASAHAHRRGPPMAYELYSWPDSSAGWNFCLAPSPSGVYMTAEQIFGKKSTIRGVGELNQRVSQLPGGTTIYWLERIPPDADPKTKDSKSLRYPPEDVIQQVRRHAQLRDVRIQF